MDLLNSLIQDNTWLTEEQSLAQILQKTLELLGDGQHWTKEAQARDAQGNKVHASDESAVYFSLEGALARASNDIGVVPPSVMRILDQEVLDYLGLTRLIIDENDFVTDTREPAVAGVLEERDIAWFNDSYSFEEILKFLRHVLEKSK